LSWNTDQIRVMSNTRPIPSEDIRAFLAILVNTDVDPSWILLHGNCNPSYKHQDTFFAGCCTPHSRLREWFIMLAYMQPAHEPFSANQRGLLAARDHEFWFPF
jgi:hypothetical protein